MESIQLCDAIEALDRIIEAMYERETELIVAIELAYQLREELADILPFEDD